MVWAPPLSSWQSNSSLMVALQRVVPSGRTTSAIGLSTPDALSSRTRTRSPIAPVMQWRFTSLGSLMEWYVAVVAKSVGVQLSAFAIAGEAEPAELATASANAAASAVNIAPPPRTRRTTELRAGLTWSEAGSSRSGSDSSPSQWGTSHSARSPPTWGAGRSVCLARPRRGPGGRARAAGRTWRSGGGSASGRRARPPDSARGHGAFLLGLRDVHADEVVGRQQARQLERVARVGLDPIAGMTTGYDRARRPRPRDRARAPGGQGHSRSGPPRRRCGRAAQASRASRQSHRGGHISCGFGPADSLVAWAIFTFASGLHPPRRPRHLHLDATSRRPCGRPAQRRGCRSSPLA
jgi:hypothetical protein